MRCRDGGHRICEADLQIAPDDATGVSQLGALPDAGFHMRPVFSDWGGRDVPLQRVQV